MFFNTITTMVHQLLRSYIQPGQIFVDATVGNGYDTLFLAQSVGENGRVIGFDIQEKALEEALKKIKKEGVEDRVSLIHDCHSKLDCYIKDPIDGAMFNLGYLPKGDSTIITTAETTLQALRKSISLLKPGGIITVISYYGHDGGEEEKKAVDQYLKNINEKEMTVGCFSFINRHHYPPILYIIEKRKNRKK